MRIQGTHTLAAPRQRVWDALVDPAVLARTLPGCRELQVTAPDRYRLTVTAGVASIKGVYAATVALTDQQAPDAYTLTAAGQGAPGTVDATARVTLSDADGGTRVDYDADAVVGGAIGGVGQRVLAGVAKRTAGEFFSAVDRDLAGAPEEPDAATPDVAADVAAVAVTPAGVVHRPAAPAVGVTDARALLAAAVTGAAIALLGVVVGRWPPTRRRAVRGRRRS